jgi:hypothetical protein
MREIRMSGSRSGTWKRSRAELVRHRQTKGPATDRLHLNHRATSRLYPFPPAECPTRSGCVSMAYMNTRYLVCVLVSALSPSVVPKEHAPKLNGEKCRYNGDHEKAMGLQAKEHQGLVGWLV